jgi:hypothetical protein
MLRPPGSAHLFRLSPSSRARGPRSPIDSIPGQEGGQRLLMRSDVSFWEQFAWPN